MKAAAAKFSLVCCVVFFFLGGEDTASIHSVG